MNLDDGQILEINELCSALADGVATQAQRTRLGDLLRHSEAARRYYVRLGNQSASLHLYAGEMQADDASGPRFVRGPWWRRPSLLGPMLAAAAIVVVSLYWRIGARRSAGEPRAVVDMVARLTGAKDAQWARGSALAPGSVLRKGQRVELESGYAEITFDSGARVVLEGAAALDIVSAWDAALQRGTLKADVPPEAIGFRISNRFVDVMDLGTEFTLIATEGAGAELLVNKGEVEAAPRGGETETILLRENEARRFAASGISEVTDRERKLTLFDAPLAFERLRSSGRFAHWTFDEANDPAHGDGTLLVANESTLQAVGEPLASATRSEGRWNRALHFDGQRYASARVPGISGSTPRTIAFWVKVPIDAQPLDTWMIGWGTQLSKLGKRPVHIGWNRRPSEGALGALRTDFGGGHAVGTTNLRDGHWHHVAVFFAPGDDPHSPVQVKQYVDGRLESSTIMRGLLSSREGTGDAAIADRLWLGYRLTGNRQEGRRFRGDLDELFVIERALQPHEIVALMKENRLPDAAVAANR